MSKDEGSQPPSLDSVMNRLEKLKQTQKQDAAPVAPTGDAARAAIDFASACAAGSVLGYGLDYWLGTTPWCLLVGLFFGFAAGVKLLFDGEKREAKRRAKAPATNETTTKD